MIYNTWSVQNFESVWISKVNVFVPKNQWRCFNPQFIIWPLEASFTPILRLAPHVWKTLIDTC